MRFKKGAWERTSGSNGLLDRPLSKFKSREFYFVIYRNLLSDQAAERLKKVEARLKKESTKLGSSSDPEQEITLDAYEGWGPKEFPRNPNAVIIPIFWGKYRKIEIYPPQRPLPDLRDDDMELDFTIKVKDTSKLRLPFSPPLSNDKEWQGEIREWLKSYEASETGEPPTFCKPVYEFLKWREKSRRRKGARA